MLKSPTPRTKKFTNRKMAIDIMQTNLRELQERINRACERSHRTPDDIKLVAVTKAIDARAIRAAFNCGIADFGENRVQEAEDKIAELTDLKPHVTWHMIGHLQSNKVKMVTGLFDIIHSIDSMRLATMLSHQTQKELPILLQVNVSEEAAKTGLMMNQVTKAVEEISRLPNLKMIGLMTIAPLTDDPEEVRPIFRRLRQLRDCLELKHLSMGMTDDFEVAIEEGATIIRIGRAIFGDRR